MAHMCGTFRAPNYKKWADRPTPQWFKDDKLGIFIHWGAYSVPAFAETSGQLGHMDEALVHKHNPYAEWYYNTIRVADSEAAKYHKANYGDIPYDDLLDKWTASQFDADKLVKLFARAGARSVVPVTKHHDGITLWDAPGTNGRNTVCRGPKRDIVDEWAKATKENGLKFGVYYSTGIDWHFYPTEKPWQKGYYERPGIDAVEYNEYAWKQCQDLIDKYDVYTFFADIDWPKAGVAPGPYSVEALLENLYKKNPEAVVNDRFGDTHWDFVTVEYGLGNIPPRPQAWQSNRGIGNSFGHNRMEDETHYLSGSGAIALLVDVASSGGNLLLNMSGVYGGVYGYQLFRYPRYGVAAPIGKEEDRKEGWVRWLGKPKEGRVFGFVDGQRVVELQVNEERVDLASGKLLSGEKVDVTGKKVDVDKVPTELRPVCIEFKLL